MYELPPVLTGAPEEDLRRLRGYLLRLSDELSAAQSAAEERAASLEFSAAGGAAAAESAAAREIGLSASRLKELIIKTAEEIESRTETRFDSLSSQYLARSDFGSYAETISTQIEQTARRTVESYDYAEGIREAAERAAGAESRIEALSGQICRGLMTDAETGETHLGIAIAESLSFTGQTHTENGLSYYTLSPGQTLGLYTSSGWQFWIAGVRRGWFSSADGMLHVSAIAAESTLRLGPDWEMSAEGGLGIRYVGAAAGQ